MHNDATENLHLISGSASLLRDVECLVLFENKKTYLRVSLSRRKISWSHPVLDNNQSTYHYRVIMLFIHISFTTLLLFAVTVSGAPALKPTVTEIGKKVDRTLEDLTPVSTSCLYTCPTYSAPVHQTISRNSKRHSSTSLAVAHRTPEIITPTHVFSHVQVHADPDWFIESKADPPTRQYARSPIVHDRDVHFAHNVAETAHRAAAAAHHEAARVHHEESKRQEHLENYAATEAARKRGNEHADIAQEHETASTAHKSRMGQLEDHLPMRETAAAHEIETANKSAIEALKSARTARNSAMVSSDIE